MYTHIHKALQEFDFFFSSGLEVQCLDAEGKYKGKKYSERNQNRSNWSHEIRIESIIVFNILIDCSFISLPRHSYAYGHISIL